MLDNDLILSFIFMVLLFVRQISILKQPNKINYAPLMLGIGAISSVVHFIIHPDATDFILLFRESAFPFLVSLFLYIVMNIIHQNQEAETSKNNDRFSKELVVEITNLKEFMSDLENKIYQGNIDDRKAQQEIMMKFSQDIKALDTIKFNQSKFLDKFDEMELWHKNVSKEFENFTKEQMPELDNVVHKHIDILRIAEQDHYNKLKLVLEKAVESRNDITEDMHEMKNNLDSMKDIADNIANTITKATLQQLSSVTKSFENQVLSLKSHTEGVETSLSESENTLSTIRGESEIIMKQMILSSNKMNEVQEQNSGLHNIYTTIKELMVDMEAIKSDYVKSQSQLSVISRELEKTENEQLDRMKIQIDSLSELLIKKMDDSLEKLHEHYNIADGDISPTLQELSKRVQSKKSYS